MSHILSLNTFKNTEDFFRSQKVELCELDAVCFHWADSDESCLNLLQLIESNPKLQGEYQKKINSLNALKTIPLWIKNQRVVVEKSMFDLYRNYILGEEPLPISGRVDVSFLTRHGPFNSLVLAELFHPLMYQEFIMVMLLTGELSRRSFRLRFKTRLLLEQNQSVHLVNLEQMSSDGILLSSEKPIIEGRVNFFLDHHVLKETSGMSLEEMKNYLSNTSNHFLYSAHAAAKISLNTKGIKSQMKYDFTKRKRYYYFINFDRFENPRAAQVLQEFVNHSKKLIEESFKAAS